MSKTAAKRIAQTVKWLPHHDLKAPVPTQTALIHAVLQDLQAALNTTDINGIVPPENTQLTAQLQQLKTIFAPTNSPGSNPISTASPPPSPSTSSTIDPTISPPASSTPVSTTLPTTSRPPAPTASLIASTTAQPKISKGATDDVH